MKTKTVNDPSPLKRPLVCPWWFCFTFDNILRKPFHNPERMLASFITKGTTVMDIGAGMGYFTIPLARMVGAAGKVIAADLQQEMLTAMYKHARKARLAERIIFHQCTAEKIGVSEPIDFCLAFWMLHEVPDQHSFLAEIAAILKPNGFLLLVEPKLHVTRKNFMISLDTARAAGLSVSDWPAVRFSYAVLLQKVV
jgi:ubiquinone/menaquinone biosynthesis C-methylase UbiE